MAEQAGLAVVTGGGSGIGRAMVEALAARGRAVAVLDINGEAAETVAAAVRAAGGSASAHRADVTRSADLDAAITAAVGEHGALEVMVNNAGVLDGYLDVDEVDETLFRQVLEINVTGVYLGCKRALEEMLPARRGRIVNTASAAGLNGTGGGAAYIASKHAVVGLTRQMAVVYAARGIRTNCVCPGVIPTSLRDTSQSVLGPDAPDMAGKGIAFDPDVMRMTVPVGVPGAPEDIASAVCYLVSDEAHYVNGHAMVIDGGWRAK